MQRIRPRRLPLATADRWLWVWLSRIWTGWRTALVIVQVETVIAWHRRGFRVLDVEEPSTLTASQTITGATGRTRLLRYVPRTREWVASF
jgi:hypothetical protein